MKKKAEKALRRELAAAQSSVAYLTQRLHEPYEIRLTEPMIEGLRAGRILCVPRMETWDWFIKIANSEPPLAAITKVYPPERESDDSGGAT